MSKYNMQNLNCLEMANHFRLIFRPLFIVGNDQSVLYRLSNR